MLRSSLAHLVATLVTLLLIDGISAGKQHIRFISLCLAIFFKKLNTLEKR